MNELGNCYICRQKDFLALMAYSERNFAQSLKYSQSDMIHTIVPDYLREGSFCKDVIAAFLLLIMISSYQQDTSWPIALLPLWQRGEQSGCSSLFDQNMAQRRDKASDQKVIRPTLSALRMTRTSTASCSSAPAAGLMKPKAAKNIAIQESPIPIQIPWRATRKT